MEVVKRTGDPLQERTWSASPGSTSPDPEEQQETGLAPGEQVSCGHTDAPGHATGPYTIVCSQTTWGCTRFRRSTKPEKDISYSSIQQETPWGKSSTTISLTPRVFWWSHRVPATGAGPAAPTHHGTRNGRRSGISPRRPFVFCLLQRLFYSTTREEPRGAPERVPDNVHPLVQIMQAWAEYFTVGMRW